jgi:hypothetical protein
MKGEIYKTSEGETLGFTLGEVTKTIDQVERDLLLKVADKLKQGFVLEHCGHEINGDCLWLKFRKDNKIA